MSKPEKEPWYKEGLRFKCTGCGECCTGSPGAVWITAEEIAAIAEYLQMPLEDFVRKYVRLIGDNFSLIEHSKEHSGPYDCVFLKERKCEIYPVRPKQCRTFPWWPENLEGKKEWKETAKRCEGINHPDAPLITLGEINSHLD